MYTIDQTTETHTNIDKKGLFGERWGTIDFDQIDETFDAMNLSERQKVLGSFPSFEEALRAILLHNGMDFPDE